MNGTEPGKLAYAHHPGFEPIVAKDGIQPFNGTFDSAAQERSQRRGS